MKDLNGHYSIALIDFNITIHNDILLEEKLDAMTRRYEKQIFQKNYIHDFGIKIKLRKKKVLSFFLFKNKFALKSINQNSLKSLNELIASNSKKLLVPQEVECNSNEVDFIKHINTDQEEEERILHNTENSDKIIDIEIYDELTKLSMLETLTHLKLIKYCYMYFMFNEFGEEFRIKELNRELLNQISKYFYTFIFETIKIFSSRKPAALPRHACRSPLAAGIPRRPCAARSWPV